MEETIKEGLIIGRCEKCNDFVREIVVGVKAGSDPPLMSGSGTGHYDSVKVKYKCLKCNAVTDKPPAKKVPEH